MWLFFSALFALLFAGCYHFDKWVVTNYFKDEGGGGLFLVAALSTVLVLPLTFVFGSDHFLIPNRFKVILMLGGILYVFSFHLYFMALKSIEASLMAILFQLQTVITLVAGWLLLNETLSTLQIFGMLVVVGASYFIAFTRHEEEKEFKVVAVFLTILCCLCYAIDGLVVKYTKYYTGIDDFWAMIFWESLGFIGGGVLVALCIPESRRSFGAFLKKRPKVVLMCTVAELMGVFAKVLWIATTLLVPVALVSAVADALQMFWTFVIALFFTAYFPGVLEEQMSRRAIARKLLAGIAMTIGIFMMME